MSTIHSFHENASSATTASDTDIIPIIQSGVLKQITPKVLQTAIAGVIDTTATSLTITQALHGNRVVTLSSAVPIAVVLPQATGTGTRYGFVMQVAATGTSSTISVANSTDVMQGVFQAPATGTAANMGKATTATSDRMSLNGTTTGGAAGSYYEFCDVKTGFFQITYAVDTSVSFTTTPFSAAV
jgi:hypothetical protein